MTFKKPVYGRNKPVKYPEPTEKQLKAWSRNWHICGLRAYYHLCPYGTDPAVRNAICLLIDGELRRLGAETESDRVKQRAKEFEELYNA